MDRLPQDIDETGIERVNAHLLGTLEPAERELGCRPPETIPASTCGRRPGAFGKLYLIGDETRP